MFKKMCIAIAFIALSSGPALFAVCAMEPLSRSVCPPCPTNSAQFCNVCANTGVIGNLVVQNSLTLCEGIELPCCLFDASLTWGPAEMLPQAASIDIEILAPVPDLEFQLNPIAFQPYENSNITLRGWDLCSPIDEGCTPNLMTVQFVVPYDMDLEVTPSLDINFLIPGLVGQSWLKFQVNIEVLNNGDDTGIAPKLTVESFNIQVFAPETSANTLRSYVAKVFLADLLPLLSNGQFAAITVSRIPNDQDPEDEAGTVYLSALSFNYRKKQALII